jgi:hypothetical protein
MYMIRIQTVYHYLYGVLMKRWKNELVILFDLYMAYTSKWWWFKEERRAKE